jgi:hypothetical protein
MRDSSLTKERLQLVADLMRRVRTETAELHDSGAGDHGWCLGCRAHTRTRHVLEQAMRDHPWLTRVKEDNTNQFTFAIGSVPIRFYHGDPADTPVKYLAQTFGELRQLELLDLGIPKDQLLRIAVETDATGKPTAITLVEMGEDDKPQNSYVIPSDDGKVVPLQKKPIELQPVKFEPIQTEEEKRKKERKKDRDTG